MDTDEILDQIRAHFRVAKFSIKQIARVQRPAESFVVFDIIGATIDDKELPAKYKKAAAMLKAAEDNPGDSLHEFADANRSTRDVFEKIRTTHEKAMVRLVRQLPITDWQEPIRGFGHLGLAQILALTGNLSNYATVSKVWKRLGLAVINGHRQGNPGKGASAEDWIAEAYSPQTRSVIFVIADSLFKGQGIGAAKSETGLWQPIGMYGEVYAARRAHTAVTHPEWTPKHAQNDALRVMSKKLIADLWSAWRETTVTLKPSMWMSPSAISAVEAEAGDQCDAETLVERVTSQFSGSDAGGGEHLVGETQECAFPTKNSSAQEDGGDHIEGDTHARTVAAKVSARKADGLDHLKGETQHAPVQTKSSALKAAAKGAKCRTKPKTGLSPSRKSRARKVA